MNKRLKPVRHDPSQQPSSLQTDLAQRIAQQIKDGKFARGEHLTETALAQQYDVSRTPVRQALRLLEEQGFVESRANSGVFVAEVAPELALDPLTSEQASEEEIYRAIIADRATNQLSSPFSESEILGRYDAPKRLVTRALLRLTREGLIERRRGHGWTFSPMLESTEAINESYRFRMMIECGGLAEPGFRVDEKELQESRSAHLHYINTRRRAKSPADFFAMNASFHEMLARFSGNRFVEQAVRQQNQLRRFEEYSNFVTRNINLVDSCQQHLEILDALERSDREWAIALMKHHLSTSSQM